MKKCHFARILCVLLFVLSGQFVLAAPPVSSDASAVLAAAGRDQGLCVVLGCGSRTKPTLLADIAGASKMLVHGVAFDNDAWVRARAAIERAGVQGRCAAEIIPVSPLPYVADLANLVVIEDQAALQAHGVTITDVLKIVAPGGVICVYEGGRWQTQVKPRPAGMDDWTHPQGNAGGNRVSRDTVATYPVGLRWQDDLPMIFCSDYAACRGMVTAGGRCFTLSPTEYENIDLAHGGYNVNFWLVAHDAFNGLPLWKINCGIKDQGNFLNPRNNGPLTTDGTYVYTYSKDGLLAVDAATGHIVRTMPVQYPTARLLLLDGVLVAAGWQEVQYSATWVAWRPKTAHGSVQAFETKTGKLLWPRISADKRYQRHGGRRIAGDRSAHWPSAVGNGSQSFCERPGHQSGVGGGWCGGGLPSADWRRYDTTI